MRRVLSVTKKAPEEPQTPGGQKGIHPKINYSIPSFRLKIKEEYV